MDNNILSLLKLFSSFNSNQNQPPNFTTQSFYPQEAYSHAPNQNNSFQPQNNDFLSLILSLLNKNGGSLNDILSANSPKNVHEQNSTTDDEILL